MSKTAIITGCLGQDGQFLSEKLIRLGYTVIGVVKPNKFFENQSFKILNVDLTSLKEVNHLISDYKPTHVFNLAGVSDVFLPFESMSTIYQQNCVIPLNLIESIYKIDKSIKFFQASSSLMFANGNDGVINENSVLVPKYPYGISKASIFTQMKELRLEKNLHLCTGIFFNHDSEKRGSNFFTQKVVLGLKDIIEKRKDKLVLGNLNVYKDISYAGDFMDGVISQMELDNPEDFVFGSEKFTYLEDFVSKCFKLFGLNFKDYVIFSEGSSTIHGMVADSNKALNLLNWKTTKTIDDLIKIMIEDKIKI